MSTKKKTVLYVMSIVGCVLATGAGSYWQMGQLAKVNNRVNALKVSIENEGDVEKQLDSVSREVAESKQKLDHLEQGVPKRAYVPTMMTELESLGKSNGITVLGVRPMANKFAPAKDGDETARRKPYEEQLIEVKGTGTYMNVLGLLSAIEGFPKIVAVNQVTLTPKADPENKHSGILEITIELRAFLFREDSTTNTNPVAMGGSTNEGS